MDSQQPQQQQLQPQSQQVHLDLVAQLGIPRTMYDAGGGGGVRVRQHVNPLKKELQIPTDAPAWKDVYAEPRRPLVLDIGCGYGRFLLALSKAMPGHNMLGLEIRDPIIERANKWAANLGLQPSVLFLRANATITLDHTLAAYPAPIDLACVQFPDPHFKSRHKKRRTVQAQLVGALARLMPPGARVFVQSDVLEAAEHMRDMFELHGSASFQPCAELHGGAGGGGAGTFLASSRQAAGPQQLEEEEEQQPGGGEQLEEGADEEEALAAAAAAAAPQLQWAAAGWLRDNPLGVPTEREVLTTEQGLPVYRIMLRRTLASELKA